MEFANTCPPEAPALPTTIDELLGPEPYDINFVFPLSTSALRSNLIELTPFIPRVHLEPFWVGFQPAREKLQRYSPGPSMTTREHFLTFVEFVVRRDPRWILFAVLDKTRRGSPVVGVIGYLDASREQLSAEVGVVITLPLAQRTHVTSHAVGLLLRHALDTPEQGGLGLRRIVWRAHVSNEASIRVARRFGFKEEGITRWAWTLPSEKEGIRELRAGDPAPERPGRHSIVLSLCWDDWENGGREITSRQIF
jgi:RimJ/RimL family protein N-acetyltransferase